MDTEQTRIGNSALVSALNSRLVLQAVRLMQPTYRAAVARRTRLKPATVTGIVNDLLDQQLLRETPVPGQVGPRGGRPPQMLVLNADTKRILAIDLEPDVIRVALTDILVDVLKCRERLIDRFSEPRLVCRQMLELCREVLSGVPEDTLLGVGVSLPGIINRREGVAISSTNMPKWHNVPIRSILERELGLPVSVERSIHLAAFHEKWVHPQAERHSTLIISLRTGIGVSLMQRGEIYIGSRGFDGEIGHTIVDIDGRQCECGARGCLETFVSASAICERAQEMMRRGGAAALRRQIDQGKTLRPELIYSMANDGDREAAEIVQDVGRYIGIAASNMINLFAPDDVVICGSIDMAEDLIVKAVQQQIDRSALPKLREKVVVRLARAKEKAPLLGAAVLVAQQLFELPRFNPAVISEIASRQADLRAAEANG